MPATAHNLFVCLTTTSNENEANLLARISIEQKLAACAQISGPIRSTYSWNGEIQQDTEYRITFKVIEPNLIPLEECVKNAHSYDTPQWIAIQCDKVSEKYLKWVDEASNFSGFL